MSWGPRGEGEGEGRKAEMCVCCKRAKLDLNLRFSSAYCTQGLRH